MKIKGVVLPPRVREVPMGVVVDGEPVVIRLLAPSTSLIEEIQDELPRVPITAAPMTGVQKDDHGNPRKDSNGQPLVDRNFEHPDYIEALTRRAQAYGASLLIHCLEPGQIELDTKREDFNGDAVAYYVAVHKEIGSTLDAGQKRALGDACLGILSIGPEDLTIARGVLGIEAGKPGE